MLSTMVLTAEITLVGVVSPCGSMVLIGCGWGYGCGCCLGVVVLDESMHKSPISFGVNGGDSKGKEAIMVVLENNPRPTFNNGEASMLSTMVLTTRITLVGVVIPCKSMVLIIAITLVGVISP